jgi:predicted O-methyltransferase YrrM
LRRRPHETENRADRATKTGECRPSPSGRRELYTVSAEVNRNRYLFTNDWFDASARPVWDSLIPLIKPKTILEVGSYEGASACYLITRLASDYPIELHCIDNWEGGLEHKPGGGAETDMQQVEYRFVHNTEISLKSSAHKVELHVHKGHSDVQLSSLIAAGKLNYFDFVYIDGSHQAPDVLSDAILGFKLVKVGGVIGFDDYLWFENLPYGRDPIRSPKLAIDCFSNIYCRKINIIQAPNRQFYAQKISA